MQVFLRTNPWTALRLDVPNFKTCPTSALLCRRRVSSLETTMDDASIFRSSSSITDPSARASQQPNPAQGTGGEEAVSRFIIEICRVVLATNGEITLGKLYYLCPLKTIGRGASFTVKAVDQKRAYYNRFNHFNLPNEYFNKELAFKSVRRFPPSTPTERAKKFRMMLLEVSSLTHPSLSQHENIVKFRGLGWEPCYFGGGEPWPVLMVELAPFGTLADLQRASKALSVTQQADLILDVLLGLDAVHQSGIVHGDVKSENVLVFSHDQRTYTAKIGDFAFANFEEDHGACVVHGTFPWQAPEIVEGKVDSFEGLTKADM